MSRQKSEVLRLDASDLDVELRQSTVAKYMRIRVGTHGVAVVQPQGKTLGEVQGFLEENQQWVRDQLTRIKRLGALRKPLTSDAGTLLVRGKATRVSIRVQPRSDRMPRPKWARDHIAVMVGDRRIDQVDPAIERFLKREARMEIERCLSLVLPRIGKTPAKVYLRSQRTKWGNCSSRGNLSFNWRLIMTPEYVLRYIVVHEAVHLAIPDHSPKFWLTVQSLCPETERARQWLCAFGEQVIRGQLSVSTQ